MALQRSRHSLSNMKACAAGGSIPPFMGNTLIGDMGNIGREPIILRVRRFDSVALVGPRFHCFGKCKWAI